MGAAWDLKDGTHGTASPSLPWGDNGVGAWGWEGTMGSPRSVCPSLQWGDTGMGGDSRTGMGAGVGKWDHGGQGGTGTPRPSVPITTRGVTWGWDGEMGPKGLGWDQDPRPSVSITAVG